jgi:acyl-coenzyme A thioesterase PaaI-like protein
LRFTFRFLERHLGLGDLVAGGTVGSRADSIIACLDL